LLLGLACTLPTQLVTLDKPVEESPATKIAGLNRNHQLATEAYAKIDTLASYRQEIQQRLLEPDGGSAEIMLIKERDAAGNLHLTLNSAAGQPQEIYIVEGQAYSYDSDYEGWVAVALPATNGLGQWLGQRGIGAEFNENPAQILAQFGAVPGQASQGTWAGRPARYYELAHIMTEMAAAFDQPIDSLVLNLKGGLWIDEATGALLKSEFALIEEATGQERQHYRLELTEINILPAITLPGPVVDPAAIVAATATAQVWTNLVGEMNFRGTPVTFELIPLTASQRPDSSPLQAEVQILIRQLPDHILRPDNIDPFLTQLRQQLTLSLPRRNLIVTSSGYQGEQVNPETSSLTVVYTFNADLEDFDRAELIFAGPGNPQFAPVPVE